jgi:hypothetical protein
MDVLPPPPELAPGPAQEPPSGPEPTAQELVRYVVGAAVWAPSIHNTQPWRFSTHMHGHEISLYADSSRQLKVADPSGREMMISCGAALFTARLALRSLGRIPETSVLPDPARPMLVARVSWRRLAAPTEYELRLFNQVLQRRTHRGGFDPLPLSPDLLATLQAAAERHGAALRVVTDEGTRAALADAVDTAERSLRLDAKHVQELASWTSPPGSTRSDGVPDAAYPARAERTHPNFPGRDFAHGHGWGRAPFSGAVAPRSAGVVCLLTTADDRPVDWVNAGQALQRVLLISSTCGVAAALHSQPLELSWLRGVIRTRLSDGTYPQLVLRLGTVIQTAASVRRPLDNVLSAVRRGEQAGASHE